MPPTAGEGIGIDRAGDAAHRLGVDPRRDPVSAAQAAGVAVPPVFSWRSFGLSARHRDRRAGRGRRSDTSSSPTGSGCRPVPPPGWRSAPGVAWAILGGAAAGVAAGARPLRDSWRPRSSGGTGARAPGVRPPRAARPAAVLHTWQYQGRVVLTRACSSPASPPACSPSSARRSPSSSPGRVGSTRRWDGSSSWRGATSGSTPARSGPSSSSWCTGVIPGLLARHRLVGLAGSQGPPRRLAGEPHERPRLPPP